MTEDAAARVQERSEWVGNLQLWLDTPRYVECADCGAPVDAPHQTYCVTEAARHVLAELATLRERIGGYEDEQKLMQADLAAFVTDCSTPTFQLVRNALDQLSALREERDRLVTALDAAMCPRCDQTIRAGHSPDCPDHPATREAR